MPAQPPGRHPSDFFKRFRWLRASAENGDIDLDELHRFIDQCLVARDEIDTTLKMVGDILRRQGGMADG